MHYISGENEDDAVTLKYKKPLNENSSFCNGSSAGYGLDPQNYVPFPGDF
jgi:hypothetical protein